MTSRHLFGHWSDIARRLRAANRLALFLDFDGTLAPLKPRPGRVRLGAPIRRILGRLARHPQVRLYLISGRRLRDLRKRAGVRDAFYLGLHGWERRDGVRPSAVSQKALDRARRRIARRLGSLPGIWIEDKRFGLSIHHRAAGVRAASRARALVHATVKAEATQLRLLKGKKVWEILPREVVNKGAGVRAILAGLSRSVLPIYVGDDDGDEPAFAALRRGLTIRVGARGRTRARFRLSNPREVREFLQRVEAEIA